MKKYSRNNWFCKKFKNSENKCFFYTQHHTATTRFCFSLDGNNLSSRTVKTISHKNVTELLNLGSNSPNWDAPIKHQTSFCRRYTKIKYQFTGATHPKNTPISTQVTRFSNFKILFIKSASFKSSKTRMFLYICMHVVYRILSAQLWKQT